MIDRLSQELALNREEIEQKIRAVSCKLIKKVSRGTELNSADICALTEVFNLTAPQVGRVFFNEVSQ